MVMEDALVSYSCPHGDIRPSLAGNLNNGTLADDVPSPLPPFCEVETHFISEYDFRISEIDLKQSIL